MLANKEAFNLSFWMKFMSFHFNDGPGYRMRNANASSIVFMFGNLTERKFIVDYKTSDSCEDGHFERSCRQYGYKFGKTGMYIGWA